MAATGQRKQLALDTNLVFDLAEEKDFAHEFREVFQAKGYALLLPPTTLQELLLIRLRSELGAERELAGLALRNVKRWGLQPYELGDVQRAIADHFARLAIQRGLLPEGEFNDGHILAETSLAEIPLLVTSDHHLLDIEDTALRLAFTDADLTPVSPAHPKRLLRAVR